MDISREVHFQQDILQDLAQQGWLVGEAKNYNRELALYPEDVLSYYQEAYPKLWERFVQKNPHQPEQTLLNQTVRALEKQGTLSVLRHGFKVLGTQVNLCSFKPDHNMNPDAAERYALNRLRVVEEVSYSPHAEEGQYNPRIDLVLFVNGLPVATLELKSEFKQSIENAKRQYKNDRPIKALTNRKNEPLLTFKRGALVHFAVTQQEVAMTTRLAGSDTFFLPFNLGTEDGGKGNPAPKDENSYATQYLWETIFDKDNWLKILGRFMHLQIEEKENEAGRIIKKETMIFPRFHQWDAVTKLIADTAEQGAGQRYLIQHSAGSGKSNSIAWTAHQLAQLYNASGEKLFDSVIVITDRTVLDNQLQETIYQFEHAQGVVCRISNEGSSASKSQQLKAALESKTRIIVVTIQTFPALYELLASNKGLVEGNYAVIADEAHSSQTGSAASKLRAILGHESNDDENEEFSSEDLLEAAVQNRGPSAKISYYAFTATPKARTIELFGRLPNPELPASADNKPEAFHLYSMRQAIEEGFIIDVLKNYITYSVAWKLAHPDADIEEVDSKKAKGALARWVKLHPHNISQKVEIIVEHFRENVLGLLNGEAKAMLVTGSRQEAVRYQLAMQKYIREQGYRNVFPLVAFSGSVPADDAIPEEVTEYSTLLNPNLKGRDHAKAFDTKDYNVLLVASKYQTGFDQPKLCAMYVDKKLDGVSCVQTLSRLNRLYPDKETFILDFFNEGKDILEAFMPYYNKAELTDVTDPQIIYDLQNKLDEEQIYHQNEVDNFAEVFFKPNAKQTQLGYYCAPARDRFKKRYELLANERAELLAQKKSATNDGDSTAVKNIDASLKDVGVALDTLKLFRKNLASFVRLYEFLSQIQDYEDTDLEKLCVFAKHLHPLLKTEMLEQEQIDLSELQLTHYRIRKQQKHKLRMAEEKGEYDLEPITEVGTGVAHDPDKKLLAEIIEKLNEVFGGDTDERDMLHILNKASDTALNNETAVAQVKSNTEDQAMLGVLPSIVENALLDGMADYEKAITAILSTRAGQETFSRMVYQQMRQKMQGS